MKTLEQLFEEHNNMLRELINKLDDVIICQESIANNLEELVGRK